MPPIPPPSLRRMRPRSHATSHILDNLLGIAGGNALNMRLPLYINSIFGMPRSWIPPFRRRF